MRACSKASIGGEKVGRYSFLAAEPFLAARSASAREVTVTDAKRLARRIDRADNPLDELRERVQAVRVAKLPELPPFVGGAVGYAGYDTVRYVEKLAERAGRRPQPARPVVRVLRPHDRVRQRAEDGDRRGAGEGPGGETGVAGRACDAAYDDACRRVDRLVEKLSTPTDALPPADIDTARRRRRSTYQSNFTQAAVRRRRRASASSTSAPATSFRS